MPFISSDDRFRNLRMKIAREYYGLVLFTALIIFFAFVPYSWSRINSVEYNADNIPIMVMVLYFCGPALAAFISAALIDDDRGILELFSGMAVVKLETKVVSVGYFHPLRRDVSEPESFA